MTVAGVALVLALVASCDGRRGVRGPGSGAGPGSPGGDGDTERHDTDGPGPGNGAPTISSVTISPAAIKVDGPVRCTVAYSDPDGDAVEIDYTWRNESTGLHLGTGDETWLSPDDILPGDTLRCEVEVADPAGESDVASAEAEPVCGFYDYESLQDVSFEIVIFFRPYKTADLNWDIMDGEPWDWDGDIPDEVFDLADALSDILGIITSFYPDPYLVQAAQVLEYLTEIGTLVDEYAPMLLEESVPPDPDLYPYLLDEDSHIYPYWEDDEGIRWDDTYEVGLTASHQDLYHYAAFATDLEDIDAIFDDNMGDWLDHESNPLILTWEVFYEGAYCSSVYYNPTDESQLTDVSYVPSSVLWMHIDTW